jgi:hypothetical protein
MRDIVRVTGWLIGSFPTLELPVFSATYNAFGLAEHLHLEQRKTNVNLLRGP